MNQQAIQKFIELVKSKKGISLTEAQASLELNALVCLLESVQNYQNKTHPVETGVIEK